MPTRSPGPESPRAARARCFIIAVATLALVGGFAHHALADAPSFTFIAPESLGGVASGISADGQSVAGWWNSSTTTSSYIWHAATGRYDFGNEPGILGMVPFGISGDGQTVVGRGSTTSGQAGMCRWSGPGTFQVLGTLGNYSLPTARGASNDASVIVGEAQDSTGNFGQAFRWTAGGGMQGLGYLRPGADTYSTAQAVSRDGSTIVGWSQSASLGIVDAFRWTESGGMVALPRLDAAIGADARAVNFDGSIIVGYASLGRAVMWRDGQATSLGHPTGWRSAVAQCVDDTGVVVGGRGTDGIGNPGACVWTPGTGMVPLADYLTANGVTIPAGWTLRDCTGVSADGMTFVGYGASDTRAGGFIATIPSPGPLAVGLAALPLVARRRRPTSSPNSPDRS